MIKKRTMTINLNDSEMNILEAICEKKGLSKTALVRQSIRLYQSIDSRIDAGEKLYMENPVSKEKSELMVL
ncbi:hypothetical protein BMS3Abin11_02488 [bacterium BMS3Abin11]|nr:hypothetical protein BMS3Abin11_02488 [bacterium BMS3Abin11]